MMMMMLKYFLVNTTSGIVSPLPAELEGGGMEMGVNEKQFGWSVLIQILRRCSVRNEDQFQGHLYT